MLEQKIQELIEALQANTAAIAGATIQTPGPAAIEPKKPRASKKAEEKAPENIETAPIDPAITWEVLAPVVQQASEALGRQPVINAIWKHGAPKVKNSKGEDIGKASDVPQANWPAFHTELEALLEAAKSAADDSLV